MLHVQRVPFQDLIFSLNMAKLFAVLISSLRLFQSRLPLNFNEFVPNLCNLAGGSLQSILLLKSYSTTFLVKRSHIYGGFKCLSVLYTSTISFCRFFVNCLSSIPLQECIKRLFAITIISYIRTGVFSVVCEIWKMHLPFVEKIPCSWKHWNTHWEP